MDIKIGVMYGRWLVLEKVKKTETMESCCRGAYFRCECQCKNKTLRIVHGRSLRDGRSASCGCIAMEKAYAKRKDETGRVYGKWLVLKQAEIPCHRKGRGAYFLCECQNCKNQKVVSGNSLRSGGTTNCGCMRKEIRNKNAPYNLIISDYQRSAKKRGLEFKLTFEDVQEITQKKCHYCGAKPSGILKPMHKHDFVYNGIDRFDNTKGYLKDNCVPCCTSCNTAKMAKTFEEFDKWICNTYHYLHPAA